METAALIRDVQAGRRGADEIGHGLPASAYTSEDFLRLEYERVFRPNWTFVGFAHEIPEPGDMIPAMVGDCPIILIRDQDGAVRAFHNVCRHRGTKLLSAPCRQQALTCPYHGWAYGLDGTLKSTPHFGGYRKRDAPGFDRGNYGLMPARSVCWHDWVFVNLDGAALDFEIYAQSIMKQVEGFDLEALRPLAKIDLGTVRANWKFLVENFIEPYHVPIVHHSSASGQPLRGHRMLVDGNCFGCAVDVGTASSGVEDSGSSEVRQTETLDMSSRYLALFPNFLLGIYFPDQVGVHLNVPEGPDRTHQWRVIYHIGDGLPDPATVDGLRELWYRVHKEDHAIIERLQAGRASPVMADGGLLSPYWETSIRQFHEMLATAIAEPVAGPESS